MPQCQFPVFCCFLVSEKLLRKYSRNCTKQKPKSLFFPTRSRTPKRKRRREPRRRQQVGARLPPLPRRRMMTWPRASTAFALSPIYCPRRKNPKTISLFPRRVPLRRRHRRQDSGDRSLCFGTLPGRGIAPEVISINSTAISIAVADSYDEE